jgi:hypothetical protein
MGDTKCRPRCKPDTWGTRLRVNSTAWGYATGRRGGVALENEIESSRKEVWTAEDK